MNRLSQLYRHNLALLTDLYQLTMAYGYWKCGLAQRQAVFHLTFRQCPFAGEYAIACGLAEAIDFLRDFHFDAEDAAFLRALTGADGQPLFEVAFLQFLQDQPFRCDVHALPEGTPVFPHEPLVRVRGPLWQAQVVETALLNIINFQTLVATKAARICQAVEGDSVLEFGLRRAQGMDGGLSASRAAYIGGCHATSNVLAGKLFGIPVRGTHAHSWVMAYGDDATAFRAYAAAMPNNCVFLVDTYDTLDGVRQAAKVGRELQKAGHKLLGVRLDSGELCSLSISARKILDEAGLPEAAIVASNDLDEHEIERLKRDGAKIDIWGVGTRLVTAYDQPALGGVYKLAALQDEQGEWQYRIKLSQQAIKVSDPGILQVRRHSLGGKLLADVLYDEPTGIAEAGALHPYHGGTAAALPAQTTSEDLLRPIFRSGELVYEAPDATDARQNTLQQLTRLDSGITRLSSPQPYLVALEARLGKLKNDLIAQARREHS